VCVGGGNVGCNTVQYGNGLFACCSLSRDVKIDSLTSLDCFSPSLSTKVLTDRNKAAKTVAVRSLLGVSYVHNGLLTFLAVVAVKVYRFSTQR
jgi:hypothetical protein